MTGVNGCRAIGGPHVPRGPCARGKTPHDPPNPSSRRRFRPDFLKPGGRARFGNGTIGKRGPHEPRVSPVNRGIRALSMSAEIADDQYPGAHQASRRADLLECHRDEAGIRGATMN